MRTAQTFGAFGALVLLLCLAGAGVGCHQPCTAIAPGTPATDLPLMSYESGPAYFDCHVGIAAALAEELVRFGCCERTDAGRLQCSPPPRGSACEFRWVNPDSYAGDGCGGEAPDRGREFCGVWIRDSGVLGVCSQCELN